MAIAFVQAASNSGSSGSATATISAATAGNILVVIGTGLSSTPGGSWTITAGAGGQKLAWRAASGGETSVSLATSGAWKIVVLEYSGVDTSSPLDTYNEAYAVDGGTGVYTHNSNSITPTASVERLFIGSFYQSGITWASEQIGGTGTGVTERGDTGGLCAFDRIVTSTSGSYTGRATGSAYGYPYSAIYALKAQTIVTGAAALSGSGTLSGTPSVPDPSLRASFGNTTSNGPSCAVTLPTGIATGDVGVIVATTNPVALTTPSGWTLVNWWPKGDQGGSTPNVIVAVWKRIMASTDSGTTVTLTRSDSSNGSIVVVGGIWQNAGDVGCFALSRDPTATNPNGQTVRFPGLRPAGNDAIVAFSIARGQVSLALTAPKMSTPPSGFTIQQNLSAQTSTLAFAYGATLMTAPPSTYKLKSTTGLLGDQSYRIGGVLTISPAGQTATDAVPGALSGAALHGYGTSYLGWNSDSYAHSAEAPFYERIASRMGTDGVFVTNANNLGLPGAFAADIAGFAFGTVSYYTRAVSSDTGWTLQQAGTWTAQSGRSGLVLLDLFANDAFHDADSGASTKARAGARNAAEALVRLLRAGTVVNENDAGITYGGTWSTNASQNDCLGGTNKVTTAPGATATFTVTGDKCDLILLAFDDAAFGATGATFSVKVDGVTVKTGTTSNQMKKSAASAYNQQVYTQMPVALSGMGAGTHTVVLTHTGSSGQYLGFDGYLVPSSTPPVIAINRLPHFAAALWTSLGQGSNTVADTYSQIATDIAALFPSDEVIVYDPLANGEWDVTSMVTTYDNTHLNDVGEAHYTSGIIAALKTALSSKTGAAALGGSGALAATGRVAWAAATVTSGTGVVTATAAATHRATAALPGTGTLTATAKATWKATGAVAGSGTVAASATAAHRATAAVAGTGSLTATGRLNRSEPVALTAAGALSARGSIGDHGHASPSATGTLTAIARLTAAAAASTAGAGTVAAIATVTHPGIASPTGSGALTATATTAHPGAATATGSGSLTATGLRTQPGTAAPAASGTTNATGAVAAIDSSVTMGTGSLTAVAATLYPGVAGLDATGLTTATATTGHPGQSAMIAAGAVTATAVVTHAANAALTADGTVTASAQTGGAAATLTATGTLTATAQNTHHGTAAAAATGALTATAALNTAGHGDLTATGTLAATAAAAHPAAASLTGHGTIIAAGRTVLTGTADPQGAGTVSAAGSRGQHAAALVSASGTAAGTAVSRYVAALLLTGNATINVTGVLAARAAATLSADGSVTVAIIETAVPATATLTATPLGSAGLTETAAAATLTQREMATATLTETP